MSRLIFLKIKFFQCLIELELKSLVSGRGMNLTKTPNEVVGRLYPLLKGEIAIGTVAQLSKQ